MVIGRVKMMRTGLTNVFTIARRIAVIIAVRKSSTIKSLVIFPTR
jgi:hypothetical protein